MINNGNMLFLSGSGVKGPPGAPGDSRFGIKGRAGPSGPPGMPGPKVTWTHTDRQNVLNIKTVKDLKKQVRISATLALSLKRHIELKHLISLRKYVQVNDDLKIWIQGLCCQ